MSTIGLVLLILVILLLVGGIPTGGYGRGHGVSGVLGVVLIVVIILVLSGRL